MANLFSNNYRNLSYWFSEITLDNNGEVVSDINAGITKLIPGLMEDLNNPEKAEARFIIPDCQIGTPDIAAVTFYTYEDLWWYICICNSISNPFDEYNNNFLFYVFPEKTLSSHDTNVNITNNSSQSKIGKIVELN